MATSRCLQTPRRLAVSLVGLATVGAMLAACDALLGLGDYAKVTCAVGCDAGDESAAPRDSGASGPDVTLDAGEGSDVDAGQTGQGADAGDAASEATPLSDATPDAPPLTAEWAQWPMPNPDAGVYPGASQDAALPNPISYDAGADGGAATAYDNVTGLTWYVSALPASGSLQVAAAACNTGAGSGFQVPTRIQLATLIDFTRAPLLIDTTTFHGVTGVAFWTSSPVIGAPSGTYWTIDWSSGLTSNTATASQVLCVAGP